MRFMSNRTKCGEQRRANDRTDEKQGACAISVERSADGARKQG